MGNVAKQIINTGFICFLFSSDPAFVLGDFGDTVDPTFNCPAWTTCKQVCVPEVGQCPFEMLCSAVSGKNETLCPDGTCNSNCVGHEVSPCVYKCASVACNKVDNYYDQCQQLYSQFWDYEESCGSKEISEESHLYTFTEPGFILCYVWFGSVPLLLFCWCFYNQRISPILPGSCKRLNLGLTNQKKTSSLDEQKETAPKKEDGEGKEGKREDDTDDSAEQYIASKMSNNPTKSPKRRAWQTGYKAHPVGFVMYFLTFTTICSIYFLLCWLIVQYYIQQEAISWWWTKQYFDDEQQVLLCFILVWMYGLLFTFSLKFPYSIQSIHLRRCDIMEADYIAIGVQRMEQLSSTQITFERNYIKRLTKLFGYFYGCIHAMLTWWFSYKNHFGCERKGVDTTFAIRPVYTDEDGTKYLTFEFRRYNLENTNGDDYSGRDDDDDGNENDEDVRASVPGDNFQYVPGEWKMPQRICDICSVLDNPKGLTLREVEKRRQKVGYNKIEMEKPSFLKSFKKELSTPFYTYQIFMVFSWIPLWYYYMGFTWLIVIVVGAVTVALLDFKNARSRYRMTQVSGKVRVLRNGEKAKIAPDGLVPGDIVFVKPGVSYCDMVLVSSNRLLVDESALTGEAHPIGKVALDPKTMANEVYDETQHKHNTIFAGTTVLEAGKRCRAVVLKTASYTARGELIRDIFSYRRHVFKFDTEIPIVVTLLCIYACIGWAIAYYWTGDYFVFGWFYGIYVVSGCLPPLLPTVFTVSVGVSDGRLRKKNIACTNAESVLVVGKVTRAFFDKTGTITKQGLDFLSAIGTRSWFQSVESSKDFRNELLVSAVTDELKLGMACCHSLVTSDKGKMIGNYVDQVMFTNSDAKLDEFDDGSVKITDSIGKAVTVVRRFDFDQHRMTQSVIVRDNSNGKLSAFCKGSGEAIRDLCIPETIPLNFDSILKSSARMGVYQISMASKALGPDTHVDISKITRNEVESDLRFEGIINFKNTMRENAPEVFRELEGGEVISTMVTGDSVLTGICIGRESGIIKANNIVLVGDTEDGVVTWRTELDAPVELPTIEDIQKHSIQLAISGIAWQNMLVSDHKLATTLQEHIRIFGRCTPQDKISVVLAFVKAGYITLMCGDGGNDCGAIKAAHVGVALSDAEASMVAPFTSLDKEIASVISVIREGRCALTSAFASYKFIIMYGQILTINQLIAAYFYITFSEWAWVFMDGVWTIMLSFALPLARASKRLAPSRPTASILGLHTMSSALGVLLINLGFVVISFFILYGQDWFQCRTWNGTDVSNLGVIGDNYETQVLWLITGYQIISAATVYNFGYEFRQAWICNWVLVLFLAGFSAIHFYITLVPGNLSCFFRINCLNEYTFEGVFEAYPVQNDFNTTIMPQSFRNTMAMLMAANTLAAILWDFFVVNGIRQHVGKKRRAKEQKTRNGIIGTKLDEESLAPSPKTESSDESEEKEAIHHTSSF